MLATTGVTHAEAVTDLLRALTGLKGWFREIQHGVYDGHAAAELAAHAATTTRLLTDLTEPRHPKQDRS